MKRTLETNDVTIKGLEDFCKEARANGSVDDDPVELFPQWNGDSAMGRRTRPASVKVELPTPLRRVIRSRKS